MGVGAEGAFWFVVQVCAAGLIMLSSWLVFGRAEQVWRNHRAWRSAHGDAPTSGIWQPVALALVFFAVAIWLLRMA